MNITKAPAKRDEHQTVAARAAGAVRTQTTEYVTAHPDLAVPAMVLVLLYPAAQFGHLFGLSPMVGMLAVPVAALVWLASHKAHGDCQFTRIVTAAAALAPVWLAVAASLGVFRLPVLIGYTTGAALLWCCYARSSVLSDRKARRAAQIAWAAHAATVNMAGAGLRGTTGTRLGVEYKIDVRGTQKRASEWCRSKLPEDWAAAKALPSEARIVVRRDPGHTGQILVEERTRNPWQETNAHPAVNPKSEWDLPAVRSIHDGPVEVGADPASGRLLALPLYGPEGAKHAMVVAGTGGGKTVLGSDAVERVTACTDALVWAIDIESGAIPALWADALDWAAGVGEAVTALDMLRAAKKIIQMRAAAAPGENHRATPTAPYLLIWADEAARLLNHPNHRIATEARRLIGDIVEGGRKAAVSFVFESQRGAIAHAGTMSVKASADIRVCLRVTQTSEMGHILPGWQDSGAPDMSKYGEGYAGVAAIQVGGGAWQAGRAFDLSDAHTVRGLAERRGAPTATLEPHIVAALGEPYAARRASAQRAVLPQLAAAVEEVYVDGESDTDREFRTITRSLGEIGEAVEQTAALQVPDAERLPIADLVAARQAEQAANGQAEVPGIVRVAVGGILGEMGPAGIGRADLVRCLGEMLKMPPRSADRWLRVMVDQGRIVRRGATSNARYVLPDQDPAC